MDAIRLLRKEVFHAAPLHLVVIVCKDPAKLRAALSTFGDVGPDLTVRSTKRMVIFGYEKIADADAYSPSIDSVDHVVFLGGYPNLPQSDVDAARLLVEPREGRVTWVQPAQARRL